MKITAISINHMTEPLGFLLEKLHISFKINSETSETIQKQLIIKHQEQIDYQTDFLIYDNNIFEPDFPLTPRTRYDVTINLKRESGEIVSSTSHFETGKMTEAFEAKWITNNDKTIQNTLFRKNISITKKVIKARLYMTALGVYETFIDGQKVGNEFLAPGVDDYTQWIQVQTYDITKALQEGDILYKKSRGNSKK